jgi:hypothetical protein
MLQHAAFAKLRRPMRVLELPDTLFQCAGPQFAEAYRMLAAQLDEAGDAR